MTRPVETLRDARVRLLRAFTVDLGGRTLGVSGWRLRKAWHLVALLALEPTQASHRERLMELGGAHARTHRAARAIVTVSV